MSIHKKNIHPVFDRILERKDKELLMKQHSKVIWLTGLSGSGKTTLAMGIERELQQLGFLTKMLDGDNVRTGISNNLGFSPEERKENIRVFAVGFLWEEMAVGGFSGVGVFGFQLCVPCGAAVSAAFIHGYV